MEKRLQSCQMNLQLFQEHGQRFLDSIITQDETPLSLYVPPSKRESKEWTFKGEAPKKILRSGTSHRKYLMLSVFWMTSGIIKIDFTEGVINGDYYANLVKETRKAKRKPRGFPFYWLHDNAPIHSANVSVAALDECGFVKLEHPPYSPDLAPSDFFLFAHLKKELRGNHFEGKNDLKEFVENFLANKGEEWYRNGMNLLVERWRKCIEVEGSYIEK